MSASSPAVRDSQEIGYGFLAAKAAVALRRVLNKEPLSGDEVELLTEASRFLRDVSEGALITSGSIREGVSALRSIAALDVAFGPLDTLKHLVSSESQIAPVFAKLAQSLAETASGASIRGNDLQLAHQFFAALSSSLLEDLNARGRSKRNGGTLGF